MAFWKFTGSTPETFPQIGLVAQPGYVYDFGSVSPPGEPETAQGRFPNPASKWTSDPGPATDFLVSQASDLSGIYPPRRKPTVPGLFGLPQYAASGTAVCIGTGAGLVTYLGQGPNLRRSPDNGAHLYNVTLPANVTAAPSQVVEWNGYVYAVCQDTTDSLYKIYRAPITTGTTALTWSAPLQALSSGATGYGCTITATSTALLVGEYGDPKTGGTNSATIWRTTDGAAYAAVKVYGSTYRHVHCVAADPYNDGQVWASVGDNIDNCYSFSSDHGATWTDLPVSQLWQGVQISFGPDWVYVAPDATSLASLYVFDRATKTPQTGSYGDHRSLLSPNPGLYYHGATTSGSTTFTVAAPEYTGVFTAADVGRKLIAPGVPDGTTITAVANSGSVTLSQAATATAGPVTFTVVRPERPYGNAFFGKVDPATGIYYGVANNETGAWNYQTSGAYARLMLFMVPFVGGPVIRIAEFFTPGSAVFFGADNNLWFGNAYRKLIAAPYKS